MKTEYIIAGALIFALAGVGGKVAYTQYKQRGIRNNNPGNIDYSASNPWKGQTGSDGRFAVFSDAVYGIRALYKNLQTYRTKYRLVTIRGIISRWAPASENNTAAYIAAVSRAVGKLPDATLAAEDYPALIAAIIQHENGVQPYTPDVIKRGIALA